MWSWSRQIRSPFGIVSHPRPVGCTLRNIGTLLWQIRLIILHSLSSSFSCKYRRFIGRKTSIESGSKSCALKEAKTPLTTEFLALLSFYVCEASTEVRKSTWPDTILLVIVFTLRVLVNKVESTHRKWIVKCDANDKWLQFYVGNWNWFTL